MHNLYYNLRMVDAHGYIFGLLFHSKTSIQLLIVTAGTSFIDFFKALLAETGTKRLFKKQASK